MTRSYQSWYCGTNLDNETFLSCKFQSTSGLLSNQSDILSKGSRHLSSGAPDKNFSDGALQLRDQVLFALTSHHLCLLAKDQRAIV